MLNLKGRGALLTGTRRVGAVVARRLAAEGVRLAIVYRNSRDEAEALEREVSVLTDRVSVLQGDMGVMADAQRVTIEARANLEDLSFVINMASDFPSASLDQLDLQAWERGMNAARACYLLSVAASRTLRENQGPTRGHIVNFGDWAADETPYKNYLPYLTAKASIHYMTRAFALELAPYGILVNAIAPGPTALGVGLDAREWREDVIPQTPLKRESSAEDIAEMVVALLKCETITGETIRVDAGRHLAGERLTG